MYMTSSGTAWGAFIQLDSAGRPQNGEIYAKPGESYKWIIKDQNGNTVDTIDPVPAVPPSAVNVDITGTSGEALSAGDLCYIGAGGAWFKADADAVGTSTDVVLGFCVTAVGTGETTTFRTDGQIELSGPLTAASMYYASGTAGAVTATAPANVRVVGQAQSTTLLAIALNPPVRPTINTYVDPKVKGLVNGRLTLTSATPVTIGDVTAATTLYFALYGGNQIGLYTGSLWTAVTFAQLSIAVPNTTTQMYDVFVDYNDGSTQLAVTAWTNDTTRATALTTQDGVLVKTGDTQQRYVGSFRTTGSSGQTEDSFANRLVWNYYNRVPRPMRVMDGTNSWVYNTATWRQANAAATNQLAFVIGVAEVMLNASVIAAAKSTAAEQNAYVAVGLDSTSAPTTGNLGMDSVVQQNAGFWRVRSDFTAYPAVGYHFAAWLEQGDGNGASNVTWYGDNNTPTLVQSGISGWIQG